MTPAARADAILASLAGLDEAAVERALADGAHPALAHIAALADASDADDEALRRDGIAALFGGVVEPLNDGFTLPGRAAYARLFPHALWRVAERDTELAAALAEDGVLSEAALLAGYHARRTGQASVPSAPKRIAVLSRVTIGADILLTSVALTRLHQRWPEAELLLLGDAKLAGLFGGLPRVRVEPIAYPRRGPLRERLRGWLVARAAVLRLEVDLVVSPDSRLDQLGILPLGDAGAHWLWENTQPDLARPESLSALFDRWLAGRLALPPAPSRLPRVALDAPAVAAGARLRAALGPAPFAAVKLDHGGNPAKALPREAELALLRELRARGWRVLLDRGFGAEELANSDALIAALKWKPTDIDDSGKGLGVAVDTLAPDALAREPVVRFHGSIAGWAGAAAGCGVAISYDSVGHHLAAALGVPTVVAFTGYADPAFPVAWQPRGAAPVTVVEIPIAAKDDPAQWRRLLDALPRAAVEA